MNFKRMPNIGILRTAAWTYPMIVTMINRIDNQDVSILIVAITPNRLFGAKPPLEPMLLNCQIYHMRHISIKVQLMKTYEIKIFVIQ